MKGRLVFKDKEINKLNKVSSDLRARPHPAKLPTSEKKLKNILGPCMVAHTFNLSTQEAEAGKSLS